MPEFSEYVNVDISVDVDEFLDECSSREIEEVVEWLRSNGNIDETEIKKDVTYSESLFEESLTKLRGNSFKLTREDEETIIRIANKIP